MATTYLRSLEIEAFKSFEKKASVEFPNAGLVLIRGVRDDGISSGTGKTTLLNAITHALKYCPESGTEIQSWHTDKPARVELGIKQDTVQATIVRGAKSFVEFVDDGVGGRGSSRVTGAAAIDSHIEKFIGLPPELLAALTFRPQKSPGLFLSKSDSDKKSFLSLILGLTSVEEEVERAQELIKTLEKEQAALVAKLETQSFTLQNEIASRPEQNFMDVETLEQTLAGLKGQHAIAEKDYQNAKKTYNDFLTGVQEHLNKLTADFRGVHASLVAERDAFKLSRPAFFSDTTRLNEVRTLLAEVETRLKQRKQANAESKSQLVQVIDTLRIDLHERKREGATLPDLQDDIAELKKQQSGANCPTCNQKWLKSTADYNSFNTKVEAIYAEIDRISNRCIEIGMVEGDIARYEEELKKDDPLIAKFENVRLDLQKELAELQADLKVQEAAFYADFEKKLTDKNVEIQNARAQDAKAREEYAAAQAKIANALLGEAEGLAKVAADLNNRVTEMQGRINTARTFNNAKLDAIRAHDKRVDAAQTAVDALRDQIATKGKGIAAERDFVKLVGREGFLGNIFSEVLVEIATETNKILKAVPNVSHVTIRFKNESTTQKGSVKKVITPVVSLGGVERPLGASLSGGMRTVVDFAVDLAARRVICRRSGHNPAWLILDEPFEGLSAIEKECILSILKGYAEDCLILVVDHATETKESFTQVIEVLNKNGKSSIV